jgi:hypothetical protein
MPVPTVRRHVVAVRAVDEQGNVGPPAVVEVPSYVRPAGATPVRVSLVPAFDECTSPNREHGSPLDHPSCAPPAQASSELTVGSEANGNTVRSIGSARLGVVPGDPDTPVDEADVRIRVSITDVRKRSDLSDYTGELQLRPVLRITDRYNGPSESEPATTQDSPFPVTVPCAATAGAGGATCSVNTTADAVVPGAVPEGKRSVWALDSIAVTDGGPDGLAATEPNTLFARQGVFVP